MNENKTAVYIYFYTTKSFLATCMAIDGVHSSHPIVNHYFICFTNQQFDTTHNIHTMGLEAISTLLLLWLILCSAFPSTAHGTGLINTSAFEYTFDADADDLGLTITDVATGISNVRTLFINEEHTLKVKGIQWIINEGNSNASSSLDGFLMWSTIVDDVTVYTGNITLTDYGRLLPTEFEAGNFAVTSNGRHFVKVIVTINGDSDSEIVVANSYVAYQSVVSLIPMLVVLIMAMSTHLVSHLFAVFFYF